MKKVAHDKRRECFKQKFIEHGPFLLHHNGFVPCDRENKNNFIFTFFFMENNEFVHLYCEDEIF